MVEIRGVHPIEASEPVYLIDVAISADFEALEWAGVTQPDPASPPSNWQVAYDEQELPRLPDGRTRAVFFIHYLDLAAPLQFGEELISLPAPTPVPADLAAVRYDAP